MWELKGMNQAGVLRSSSCGLTVLLIFTTKCLENGYLFNSCPLQPWGTSHFTMELTEALKDE